MSDLDQCKDGNVRTYATTKELKKKEFKTKRENIKQGLRIQVTFMLVGSKLNFLAKDDHFLAANASFLNRC